MAKKNSIGRLLRSFYETCSREELVLIALSAEFNVRYLREQTVLGSLVDALADDKDIREYIMACSDFSEEDVAILDGLAKKKRSVECDKHELRN